MFKDRYDAGYKLAEKLERFKGTNSYILVLPRGGIPVGCIIAQQIKAPMEVIVSCKIGAINSPELGIGAVSEKNVVVWEKEKMRSFGIPFEANKHRARQILKDVNELVRMYRNGRRLKNIKDKIVILVDDGVATGVTAKAATRAARLYGARQVILAVPVCPLETRDELRQEVDELISVEEHMYFKSVGHYYENFAQLSQDQALSLLSRVNY